jgi:molecular chaperone GrpE (heat shock protein)
MNHNQGNDVEKKMEISDPNFDTKDSLETADSQEQVSEHIDSDSKFNQIEEEEESYQLKTILLSISEELSHLSRTIESRLTYDQTKEEAFDRLYSELDELKKNAAFEQIRPLFMDLILLFDRIENAHYELSQSSLPSSVLNLFNSINDELLEILSRREIEPIKNANGSFDPTFQRAIGVEATLAKEENNQIARVLRKGFLYRDRLLRAEEVIVKRYTNASVTKDNEA